MMNTRIVSFIKGYISSVTKLARLLLTCSFLCVIFSTSAQTRWYNPLQETFPVVRGRGWSEELKNHYQRLPVRIQSTVRKAVADLSRQSAGLSIAFRTNAREITVRYVVGGGLSMPHMPATGVSGVDLYSMDANGNQRWCAAKYAFGDTITYSYKNLTLNEADKQRGFGYTLFLPPYNSVKWMEIGVSESASFQFMPVSLERPIVVYGTSIAQGACASRPGMMWSNIVERETGHPVINLGFSGNGMLEPELFRALTEINARLYIIDCMPNLTGKDTAVIYQRTLEGVHLLRAKSQAPILLVEHSGYMNDGTSEERRDAWLSSNRQLRKAYEALRQQGFKDIYYLTKEDIGFTSDSQVEGVHPNDIGMRQYADAYIKKIHEILHEGNEPIVFKACKQQRDPYDWEKRHEAVLQLNKDEVPDILMIGNSITHYWGGKPADRSEGAKSWNRLFRGKVVHNLGFGWDYIENVLWRIYHGELDGFNAKKIFVMIGTNNLYKNSDSEIILGIKIIAEAIHLRQPGAKLYIEGILPRMGKEKRIADLNKKLQSMLEFSSYATYIDVSKNLVLSDGKIKKELFRDGLHPNEKGYEQIAKVLKPLIDN